MTDQIFIQGNLSKPNLLGTNFCVWNRQVILTKIPYNGTLFIVLFIQDSLLYRVSFDRFHCTYIKLYMLVPFSKHESFST